MGPKGSTAAHMEGPLPCNTFYPHSSKGTRTWLLDSLLMSQVMEENRRSTQYICEPLGNLRYLFRTTNECHSNEHPQNQVCGDKISQDSSKEPTQLGRGCTPKQTGDRSPDPWTRRDLCHLEWDMLFLGKYLQLIPQLLKKVSQSSRKTLRSYRISKNELESSWGSYSLSLVDVSPHEGEFGVG